MSLDIKTELAAFDTKNRNFYKTLSEEERKKFSPYMMIRWGSSVTGSSELQEYYLLSTNIRLNKNFFALNKYPELQWLCATTVSPGIGKQYHEWIGLKKKDADAPSNKLYKFVMTLYPTMKLDEIALFLKLNNEKTIKQIAIDMGMSEEQIKKELG